MVEALIQEFLTEYEKRYDFYDKAARLASQILETNLRAAGIRSIVTWRAKAPGSLSDKVSDRAKKRKKTYTSVADMFQDIVDLAGVRVAAYFPGEMPLIHNIIGDSFNVLHKREFPLVPRRAASAKSGYKKRFEGYSAKHFHVQLKESLLTDDEKRYSQTHIEIQVASVLMHAWSEVEHDLIYKPHQGPLSYEEYAILDEINGLVHSGEIGLNLLQRAGETRISAGGRHFSNHYDLAAHLLATVALESPAGETSLVRVDLLFELLRRLHLDTPNSIAQYTRPLSPDLETRPLVQQIIDNVLRGHPEGYVIYDRLRSSRPVPGDARGRATERAISDLRREVDRFLQSWTVLEQAIQNKATVLGTRNVYASGKLLSTLGFDDEVLIADFERARRTRNEVVHGMTTPSPEVLKESRRRVEEIAQRVGKI